jgi:hypothetical protein
LPQKFSGEKREAVKTALDIEVLDGKNVVRNESSPGFDLISHEGREDLISLVGVLDFDLE